MIVQLTVTMPCQFDDFIVSGVLLGAITNKNTHAETLQNANLNFPAQPCADGYGTISTSFESLLLPLIHINCVKLELYCTTMSQWTYL